MNKGERGKGNSTTRNARSLNSSCLAMCPTHTLGIAGGKGEGGMGKGEGGHRYCQAEQRNCGWAHSEQS